MEQQQFNFEEEQDTFSVEQDLLYLKSRMIAVLNALEAKRNIGVKR